MTTRPMTDEEIVRSFRNAVDQKQQVRILAELNECKNSEIKRILEDAGEKVPDLRGKPVPCDVESIVAEQNRQNAIADSVDEQAPLHKFIPDPDAAEEFFVDQIPLPHIPPLQTGPNITSGADRAISILRILRPGDPQSFVQVMYEAAVHAFRNDVSKILADFLEGNVNA